MGLYQRLRDLFDIEPELLRYDLTRTYFEGHGPAMARHGHSRDGKPRNVQVVVGVVMVAGWPITHHVWAGNTRDVTTVPEVLLDLAQRFHFRRVVFVGDRGMVSEKNLGVFRGEAAGTEAAGPVTVEAVEGSCSEEDSALAVEASEAGCNQEDSAETAACEEPQGEGTETSIPCAPRVTAAEATRELKRLQVTCGYLLGMVRRRNPEVEKLIDRVKEDAWIDCPGGINAQEKMPSPRMRVQEVPSDREGARCFVIDSDERREYEQRQREKTMSCAWEALAKVERRVTSGRLKDPAKIGAAVESALQRHYGYRYYAWELKEGLLRITEHPVRCAREEVRRQIPAANGPGRDHGDRGGASVQTTCRSGACVSHHQGSAFLASDQSLRGAPCTGTHFCGGVGLSAGPLPGAAIEGQPDKPIDG